MISYLEGVTLKEVASWVAIAIGVGSIFIQITPIKWNPISQLCGWIGRNINKPVLEKIENQDKKIDGLKATFEEKFGELAYTVDKNEIDRIRRDILDFASSCRQGKKHTKDKFEHIFELYQKYHQIIDARKMKNGFLDAEFDYIVRAYQKCQDENSFL